VEAPRLLSSSPQRSWRSPAMTPLAARRQACQTWRSPRTQSAAGKRGRRRVVRCGGGDLQAQKAWAISPPLPFSTDTAPPNPQGRPPAAAHLVALLHGEVWVPHDRVLPAAGVDGHRRARAHLQFQVLWRAQEHRVNVPTGGRGRGRGEGGWRGGSQA